MPKPIEVVVRTTSSDALEFRSPFSIFCLIVKLKPLYGIGQGLWPSNMPTPPQHNHVTCSNSLQILIYLAIN